jgi:hypothetical protein
VPRAHCLQLQLLRHRLGFLGFRQPPHQRTNPHSSRRMQPRSGRVVVQTRATAGQRLPVLCCAVRWLTKASTLAATGAAPTVTAPL